MPSRWILAGMFAFTVAAMLGLVLALVGPVAPLRTLGAITASLGVFGAILHAWLLHDADPHAWSVVRYRIAEVPAQLRARWASLQNAMRTRANAT